MPASAASTPHHTAAQRRTATHLVDLADHAGRPAGGGLVLVPTPLAELSARSGRSRNCGTLYAHIRALRPAVRRPPGQSGLLIDMAALRSIAAPSPAPRPSPVGSPGPQAPYVLASEPDTDPTASSDLRPGSAHGPAAGDTPQMSEVRELIGLVRDLVGLVRRLLDTAQTDPHAAQAGQELRSPIGEAATDVADDPRETSRTARDVAEDPRSPDRREGGSSSRETPGQNLPPSLGLVREVRDITAEVAERLVADREEAGVRNQAELVDLVGPLVRLAERANLVGLTDIDQLATALAPYHDDQIRQAVSKTAAMAKAGRVNSPIGWLITKARQGDRMFFPDPAHPDPESTTPPAPDLGTPAGPDEPADIEAETAVRAMEADPEGHSGQLEQLDRSIRGSGPIGERILADPAMRHSARVKHWRLANPSPATIRRSAQ